MDIKPYFETSLGKLFCGDCLEIMKQLPDKSVDLVLTDPPYGISQEGKKISRKSLSSKSWKRNMDIKLDFGKWDNFETENEFFKFTESWFKECVRVLKQKGWIYIFFDKQKTGYFDLFLAPKYEIKRRTIFTWLKCLSGNQRIIAKINGELHYTTIRDLYKSFNRKQNIELYSDRNEWIRLKSISKIVSKKGGINLYLHNGGVLKVTPNHKFRVNNSFISSSCLKKGDILDKGQLNILSKHHHFFTKDLGWLIGIFLAEGNYDGKDRKYPRIRLSFHKKEMNFYDKLAKICSYFNANIRKYIYDNCLTVIIEDLIILSIIKKFVKGEGSKGKYLKVQSLLKTSKEFVRGVFEGYLEGDGVKRTKKYQSYRVGLTANKKLVDSLMVLSNIMGFDFRIKNTFFKYQKGRKKGYIIDINLDSDKKPHRYKKEPTEIKRIIKSRNKVFYELSLEKSHTYVLPEGVISHNSNPCPSFRKVNWLSASEFVWVGSKGSCKLKNFLNQTEMFNYMLTPNKSIYGKTKHPTEKPEALIKKFILVSTNKGDIVLDPFLGSGTTAVACEKLNRRWIGIEMNPEYIEIAKKRIEEETKQGKLNL